MRSCSAAATATETRPPRRTARTAAAAAALILGLAAVAGCAGDPIPPDRLYALPTLAPTPTADADAVVAGADDPVADDTAATARAARPVLALEAVRASGHLAGARNIAYHPPDRPLETAYHDHALWRQPPADLVAERLIDCLRAGGRYSAVLRADVPADADVSLVAHLRELVQDQTGDQVVARLALDIDIYDRRSRALLVSGRYRLGRPAADTGIEAFIAALDQGLQAVCADLATRMQ